MVLKTWCGHFEHVRALQLWDLESCEQLTGCHVRREQLWDCNDWKKNTYKIVKIAKTMSRIEQLLDSDGESIQLRKLKAFWKCEEKSVTGSGQKK